MSRSPERIVHDDDRSSPDRPLAVHPSRGCRRDNPQRPHAVRRPSRGCQLCGAHPRTEARRTTSTTGANRRRARSTTNRSEVAASTTATSSTAPRTTRRPRITATRTWPDTNMRRRRHARSSRSTARMPTHRTGRRTINTKATGSTHAQVLAEARPEDGESRDPGDGSDRQVLGPDLPADERHVHRLRRDRRDRPSHDHAEQPGARHVDHRLLHEHRQEEAQARPTVGERQLLLRRGRQRATDRVQVPGAEELCALDARRERAAPREARHDPAACAGLGRR